jgi:hypothetical protein
MKITPMSKAGSLVQSGTQAPATPGPMRTIKMNTNVRSAGQQWQAKHSQTTPQAPPLAPLQSSQPTMHEAPQSAPEANQTHQSAQSNTGTELKGSGNEASNPTLSPQYVALARKEQALRKQLQEFKSQQEAWKQEQANYVSKKQLETDPLKTLADAGLTYDRLTELQLNQANPDPNQALLDKIAALEGRLASVDEQFTNRDKQAYDQALATIRRDTDLLISSDPAYEIIKATSSQPEVVKLIQRVFEEEGDILSVEEAAQLVEDQLVEDKSSEISRLARLSKISKKLAPARPAQAMQQQAAQSQSPSKTLTNAQSTNKPLSAVERAILAYQNGLNGKR